MCVGRSLGDTAVADDRWTTDEHARFLEGRQFWHLQHYQIATLFVKTRSPKEVRRHSQEYLRERYMRSYHAQVAGCAMAGGAVAKEQETKRPQQTFRAAEQQQQRRNSSSSSSSSSSS